MPPDRKLEDHEIGFPEPGDFPAYVVGKRAARAGIGAAVLPCYLADGDPELERGGDRIDALATDLWLLTHPDLPDTTRIRAFSSFVATSVDALHARLAGA
ncbi:hypothetical protein [Burkholderia sp. JP2-270]|uniref:hypothetical protein n=1 Tax=Burkholderia sp. JP2-270 TaxID=2217913 RepID=UPI001EF921C4|nr:hypothetical protein [Burkholderia sp. JP2-270]